MNPKPLPGKICTGCKQRLPKSDFGKREASPDGLRFRCKQCRAGETAADPVPALFPGDKLCTGCNTVRPRTEFYARKASVDGLQPFCKTCSQSSTPSKQKEHRHMVKIMTAEALKQDRFCSRPNFITELWDAGLLTSLMVGGLTPTTDFLALFRVCTGCKKELPVTRFARDGEEYTDQCNACKKESQ